MQKVQLDKALHDNKLEKSERMGNDALRSTRYTFFDDKENGTVLVLRLLKVKFEI